MGVLVATIVATVWMAAGASASSVSVETTADADVLDGECTLREAISVVGTVGDADCAAVPAGSIDTIDFNGLAGPGPHEIAATNGYILNDTVTIDASGASGEVRVDGAGASGPQPDFGFQLRDDDIVIRGLSITNWAQTGVKIDLQTAGGLSPADGAQVIDNFIGTNEAGAAGLGNISVGVAVGLATSSDHQPDNTLVEGNVISSNGVGVSVVGDDTNNTTIQGNLIGTNPAGTAALPNGTTGVRVSGDADNVTIGGGGAGEGNVISGNGADGVLLTAPGGERTTGVTVRSNTIGLGSDGATLGNTTSGVSLVGDVDGATIRGNTISANGGNGISVGDDPAEGPDLTSIRGNRIGTNPSGTAVRANTGFGVLVGGIAAGPIDTTIGGVVAGGGACTDPCNVIAGTGVSITHTAGSGTIVLGNHIGVNQPGIGALPVSGVGVTVTDADDVVVGSPIAPNTIGATATAGVQMQAGVTGGTIQANLFGTRSDGTGDLGNTNHAVELQGASGVLVGGTTPGQGNLMASNGSGVRVGFAGDNNPIVGNLIYDNDGLGIDLEEAGGFGPTPNDADDSDAGANDLQNFVDLGLVTRSNSIHLVGDLNSTVSTDFRVDVFTNPTPHPSGLGDGQVLVETLQLTTDGAGTDSVDEVIAGSLPDGHTLSLTVTELDGVGDPVQTSEFAPPAAHGYCANTPTSAGLGLILGTPDEDTLTGTGADDILCGLGNNDSLDGGPGDDLLIGGDDPGSDIVRFAAAPGAVAVDLAAGTAVGLGSDTLVGIESADGTPAADSLLGDDGPNQLNGDGGDDQINGRGGPDFAFGGAGDDTIVTADGVTDNPTRCGAGNDTVIADTLAIEPSSRFFDCEIIDRPGPPQISASGKKKQKSKSKVVVDGTCANEDCALVATGKVKIKVLKKKRGKRGRALAAKSKTLKLKAARASAAAGETKTLKLKLSRKAKKLLKKVIRKKTSKATVKVAATDGVGNAGATQTVKVKIKKGK